LTHRVEGLIREGKKEGCGGRLPLKTRVGSFKGGGKKKIGGEVAGKA